MEAKFYRGGGAITLAPTPTPTPETPSSLDVNAIAALLTNNPNLLIQVLQSVQSANPG